ncbi:MAG: FAD-binding oxidoreductase [Candidatus Binataceae bacterium]|nr:FAD-binding oxidoreductase [Candidatus Binataceae bacterium]
MNDHDAPQLVRTFAALIGESRIRAPQGRETRAASIIAEPHDAREVAEIIRKCEADAITLAPIGAGRTLAAMRPAPVAVGVSLAHMAAIIAYEPDDMTVIAEPGLTLAALNRQTAQHGQHLPADPPHPELATLGALVGAAHAGPMRHAEGTVRDLLIGVRFAGHGGRLVHGGGRVVKNVAGYDLMKVMTGSFGTLGVITETTFKVRPMAEQYAIAFAAYGDVASASAAAAQLHHAAALAHLEVASPAASHALGLRGGFTVIAGLAGSAAEVAELSARTRAMLAAGAEIMTGAEAIAARERLRDCDFADAAIVALIAVPPAELARCLEPAEVEFVAHAGCGVARISLSSGANPAEACAALARIRMAVHAAGGNLRVLHAASEMRPGLEFFDQPPRAAFALMQTLKRTFDPHGVFNPRCFVGGL